MTINVHYRRRLVWLAGALLMLVTGTSALAAKAPAVAQQCAACHGAHGQGNAQAGYPRLAGLQAQYIAEQLHAFKSGKRDNAIMHGMASGLSDAQIQAVASYYAGLRPPASAPAAKASDTGGVSGRDIAVNGLWQKDLAACEACHGPGARGVGNVFPPLAGQPASYIVSQLKAWRKDHRPPGPAGLMPVVAGRLSAAQMHAVAAYLASLPASGPVPKSATPDVAPDEPDAMPGYFQPPVNSAVPKGKFGASVRRGYEIFMHTPEYAKRYVGNGMSCANCHTNRGRQADSAPMWAAWVLYPKYRGKNKQVNTMAMRIQGCFRYSQNAQGSPAGKPPAVSSQVIRDLSSYMFWMAKGAPTGERMKGQGYPHIPKPPKPFSRQRGQTVYTHNCAACHGGDGQGLKLASGRYAFPPLWGPDSFNWGAGMHRINTAASFILHNMPFGRPGTLTVQQAWDVAAFVDSHPRPQDPRFDGNLKQTIGRFHAKRGVDDYGKTVDGLHLGAPGTLKRWQKRHS